MLLAGMIWVFGFSGIGVLPLSPFAQSPIWSMLFLGSGLTTIVFGVKALTDKINRRSALIAIGFSASMLLVSFLWLELMISADVWMIDTVSSDEIVARSSRRSLRGWRHTTPLFGEHKKPIPIDRVALNRALIAFFTVIILTFSIGYYSYRKELAEANAEARK